MKKYWWILLGAFVSPVQAEVSLPAYFSDNMVVQQKSTLVVSGTSTRQGPVSVKVGWKSESFVGAVAGGKFENAVPTPKAGGPYTIVIDDGDPLVLQNVLVGEVWFCSGQSNMEMPVVGWGRVMNCEQETAAADYPSIRLLQVKKSKSHTPADAVGVNGGGWAVCAPAAVENFSAVAYFYARSLWQKLKVPVGVIDCSWGGTPAEAWTSLAALKQVWGFGSDVAGIERCEARTEALWAKHRADMLRREHAMNACDPGMRGDVPRWTTGEPSGEGWGEMNLPTAWENAGLPDYDGSVWFRKEVEISCEQAGKALTLNLGMIDDKDVVYFNGVKVGEGNGYYVKRSYTVPAPLVKAGKNIIAVKVQDDSGAGGICGAPDDLALSAAGGAVIPLAGAWDYHIGVPLSQQPPLPPSPDSQNYPAVLYNAMVYPFRNFPIKGVIWYQGEANVDRAVQYAPLFQAMIADWRKLWKNDFPFYFVQLANFMERRDVQPSSAWAHLREAQAEALHLERTGMAVAIDIGEAYDIHPKNKQEVAARLARLALARTYGKGRCETPACIGYKIEKGTVVLSFDSPLVVKGGAPAAFAVAGPDMKFYPAEASLSGDKVTLKCEAVPCPVAARYGWADNPPCNLYGKNGLPVAPFRTDAFE